MPRPMEKKDWMQTAADVGSADGVWYENVSVDGGYFQHSVPELRKNGIMVPTRQEKTCQKA